MDDCEKQLHELVSMRTRGIIDDELFTKESAHIQSLMKDIRQSLEDNQERQRKWYEIIGKTLNTLTSPNEKSLSWLTTLANAGQSCSPLVQKPLSAKLITMNKTIQLLFRKNLIGH